jgi:hypothetical protein
MSRRTYTTEQTAKTWKGLQALGCLGLMMGIALVYLGTSVPRSGDAGSISQIVLSNLAILGILVFLVGFCVQMLGCLGGRWFHG